VSGTARAGIGQISGFGAQSYLLAVRAAKALVERSAQ